jgi:hypothetical protein
LQNELSKGYKPDVLNIVISRGKQFYFLHCHGRKESLSMELKDKRGLEDEEGSQIALVF